jgi:hypothetical protein
LVVGDSCDDCSMTKRVVVLLALISGACGGDSAVIGTASDTDATGTTLIDVTPTTEAPMNTTGGSAEGSGSETPPECTSDDDAVCNDDDACTVDTCFDGACAHVTAEDFTPCDDEAGAAGLCRDGECVVECESDDQCDDDNACTIDTCDVSRGLCVRDPLNNVEADPSEQTAGDCRVIDCDNGQPIDNADDADLPDDSNDCTADSCRGGSPLHEPVSVGQDCGDGGHCDSRGDCVDCIAPEDCTDLPPDDDCQQRTCENGVCGQTFTDANVPVNDALQSPGDCEVVVCDGAGDMESIDDDADPLVDGLECTEDLCSSGIPLNPPLDEGTDCSAGLCNSTGICVGCLLPSDCGGTNTFCQTITCVANTCGVDNTPAGVALPNGLQTPNDCQELQCNGGGMQQAVPDDEDVPVDDGNDCTFAACSNGLEQHPNEEMDTACDQDGGVVCDGAGACVECNAADQCDNAQMCEVDACIDNACTPQNAEAGVACNDGQFCTETDSCDGAGECTGSGDPCPGPDGDSNCSESCNEATDSCNSDDGNGSACDDGLFCTSNDACNAVGTCVGGADPCPGADGDGDCSETCNEGSDSCEGVDPQGSACDDGLFCTTGETCGMGGTCAGGSNPCPGPDNDGDCTETCDEAADNCEGPDAAGASCNDGLFCTQVDACAAGSCSGSMSPCAGADGDANCSESCDEAVDTCTSPDPVGSACNDGLFCNGADACNAMGACQGAGDPCTGADGDGNCAESCNETADNCTAADPVGSACNDNLFCNGTDACNGSGTCATHLGDPCAGPDGDGDCTETCRETQNDCNGQDPVGSACEDGVFCNGADQCGDFGNCGIHAGNPCPGPDGDGNCRESCDELDNDCGGQDPVGSACEDGVFCNGDDTCGNFGNCGQHTGNPCDGADGDGDCSEMCNETAEDCSANDAAGTACTDGAFCNGTDTCNGSGACSGHAGNPCTQVGDGDCDCSESCREAQDDCNGNDPNGDLCGFGVCTSGSCVGFCS